MSKLIPCKFLAHVVEVTLLIIFKIWFDLGDE